MILLPCSPELEPLSVRQHLAEMWSKFYLLTLDRTHSLTGASR
uniref:Uncharacterized protein n=1 Tax=Triticum urartu TaxID=4572 RepID=A0A8R7QCN8_TRIUA